MKKFHIFFIFLKSFLRWLSIIIQKEEKITKCSFEEVYIFNIQTINN